MAVGSGWLLWRPSPNQPEEAPVAPVTHSERGNREVGPTVRQKVTSTGTSAPGSLNRPHYPRWVDAGIFSKEDLAEIEGTMQMIPEQTFLAAKESPVIQSRNEALEAFRGTMVNWFLVTRPVTICETPNYFLLWGTHTNEPARGYAVPRNNRHGFYAWARDGDHYFEPIDPKTYDLNFNIPDSKILQGYIWNDLTPDEWRRKCEEERRVREELSRIQAKKSREYARELYRREEEAAKKAREEAEGN